ncbi:unnamed protein product [Diabrotica balteata]|uniref:EF-hand domain-containing protein n=1 Tax=Diabrotica balteata TaxID=107213 RepID=A0A9N9XD31_DIABA|nr:unnamed protein product [Diabrotica balteata]
MARYDLTLNPMEETRFLKKHRVLAISLTKQVHFSFQEVEAVLIIYYKIQKYDTYDPRGITRDVLMEVFHCCLDMTDMEKVIRIITCLDEKARDVYISKELWVHMLSLFLRGTIEEKMAFCFKVYDYGGSGQLMKENLFKLLMGSLKSNIGESDAEEAVKDMVEVIMKKMDADRDGKISFNDYRYNVLRQPDLLEFLGQCLPDRHTVHKFLCTFTENTKIRFYKLKLGTSIM